MYIPDRYSAKTRTLKSDPPNRYFNIGYPQQAPYKRVVAPTIGHVDMIKESQRFRPPNLN